MRILKLETTGCNPCKMVGNYLNDKGVMYDVVDVLDNPEIGVKYAVMSTPVTILLDDEGNELKRSIGFKPPELEQMISQL